MCSLNKLRIILPMHCQLRCKVCHNEHNPDIFHPDILALTNIMNQVARKHEIKHINISGGEPFHKKNVSVTKEITYQVRNIFPASILSLNTNAVDISVDTSHWINDNFSYVKASIYGTSDADYKMYSSVECCSKVLTNLFKLRAAGVDVKLNVISTRQLLEGNRIKLFLEIAHQLSASIKFVELICHEWFSEQKIRDYEQLYISPQILVQELMSIGAIHVSSAFDRDIFEYNGLKVETYKYPKSSEDSYLFQAAGWGLFLRADGQIIDLIGKRDMSIVSGHKTVHPQVTWEPRWDVKKYVTY